MRVVGGVAGGRTLVAPDGRDTRPTSDRAREGLFSTLASMTDLDGARVLDLYAGSGAVGLEALSRGASAAVLVEADVKAAAVIRRNADTVALPGARVVVDRVERFLATNAGAYDIAFLDPPYATSEEILARVLSSVQAGVVVVERSTKSPEPPWPEHLKAVQSRRYGDATLWYAIAV